MIIGVSGLRDQFYCCQKSMLLPALDFAIHVILAWRIYLELSCSFHQTVMIIGCRIDISGQTVLIQIRLLLIMSTVFVIPFASFERIIQILK